MTIRDQRQRYSAERDGDVWWGVFDHTVGRFIDSRRWLHSLYPGVEASRLNHDVLDPAAMLTADGLGPVSHSQTKQHHKEGGNATH